MPGATASAVSSYATYDTQGEDPGPSTWPIVVDHGEMDALGRYCAGSYIAVIADADGVVTFHAPTNLKVEAQRDAFLQALDAALGW